MFLFLMLLINDPVIEVKALVQNNKHTEALQKLNEIKPTKEQYNDYAYLKAISHFSLNQKKEAEKWVKNLQDSFEELPARYKALATLMEDDLKNWKEDDLSDVSRDMNVVEKRLKNNQHGEKTQTEQKKIVNKLDKLIKDIEDEIENSKKQPSPASGQALPMPESMPQGGESGPGKVDEKKFKQLRTDWGKLPEKERAKVMMEAAKTLPTKYREIFENYNKSLADTKKP